MFRFGLKFDYKYAMRNTIVILLILVFPLIGYAQIDTNNKTVQLEIGDTNTPSVSGVPLPTTELPSLTDPMPEAPPTTKIGEEDEPLLDMTETDGLLENKYDKAPKAFTKDKVIIPKYAKDQFLGELSTGADNVNIKYRDHEYVDGDRIRVYVNGDVVQSNVSLVSAFSGFVLALVPGENVIEFEALNQGSSGPNTAELHVYDENGLIISAKEWNLLTGRKAIIRVNKN